jgi:hypothetical protein
MPNVRDCLEHAKFLIEHGRGEEAAKLVLPRIDAQRRKANREKRTRVQFDCTPELYAKFHEQLQRYREIVGNVTIAQDIMVYILGGVSEETIKHLVEMGEDEKTDESEQADEDFVMGKGQELAE